MQRLARSTLILAAFSAGCFSSHGDSTDAGTPTADATRAPDAAAPLDAPSVDDWFEDTLGWRVRFRCTPGRCEPPGSEVPADFPVRCPDGMEPYVATTIDGRVPVMLATCSDDRGWFAWWELARPIVCRTDEQCARLQHVDGILQCVNEICQMPGDVLSSVDVRALCLASVPRPRVAFTFPLPPDVEHAYDLADTYCIDDGPECAVPPECRAP